MPKNIHTILSILADLKNEKPAAALMQLIRAGCDDIALPGQGNTYARWQILAAVAAHDLCLAKLYEGHTDALAILAELGVAIANEGEIWGVWCAEPPAARVALIADPHSDDVHLQGRKAWCSGAASLTHALVSCWNSEGKACLAAVDLRQPEVNVTTEGWHAVGMAGSGSVDVDFAQARALPVGEPGDYVKRPGFWHGGAGVAACWYGAAVAIGNRLKTQLSNSTGSDPHRSAQLGAIDITLRSARAMLQQAAREIDAHPQQNAMKMALRTRLCVEAAATQVLTLATRALGAGPLCREPSFARMVADLPVFLRQSHAERDLAALGTALLQEEKENWEL